MDRSVVNSSMVGPSNTSLQIENEQLRKDNAYLVQLLKETKQYAPFAQYIEDSGGLAYKLDMNILTSSKESKWRTGTHKNLDLNNIEDQLDGMVPANVHAIASDFRIEHGNDLSAELIHQLLANLNKIWRDREKKVVARIKTKCEAQITQMKR